jgi:predicted NBD/HSP70 family sugar kinase
LAAEYPETRLTKPYTSISIFDAARYKDPLAVAVVTNVAERIAMYIATITAVVDVELVVLSGGVGRQADVLLAEIQAFVARIVPFAPRIEVSNLGDNAVLLGGIALCTSVAQDAVFAQRSNAYQAAREVGELVR